VELGTGVIVVRNVQAKICVQCGEEWIDNQTAQQLERIRAFNDLQETPGLTPVVIDYLISQQTADVFLNRILQLWTRRERNPERLIHIARFLCEASFSVGSDVEGGVSPSGEFTQDMYRQNLNFADRWSVRHPCEGLKPSQR
jgi:hypothetical protein